jgi:tRNA-specific 2-thiouridylase
MSFVDGRWPDATFRAFAQIRAHATPVPATITPVEEGVLHVRFDEGQRGVSPGQAIVLYDDDIVLGGGRISVTEAEMIS